MITKQVAVSGAVGEQTFATTEKLVLKGILLTPISANAHVSIRDGDASGSVEYTASAMSGSGSKEIRLTAEGHRFDKGMHVLVLGTGALCYLLYD